MIVSVDIRIPFPRSLVYAIYRDKLVELVPYLPNVRSIRVKLRREEKGKVYSINEWHGGGEIPKAARAILSEKMLFWTEYNTWNETDFTMDWQIKTHTFTEAVYCAGKNCFIEEGNGTLIESRGKLMIDPHEIKGFPPYLIGQVVQIIEDFLGKKIEPNLLQMSEGVVPLNYLDGYIRIAYQSNETAGSLGSKSSSGGKRVSICLRLSRNATGTL